MDFLRENYDVVFNVVAGIVLIILAIVIIILSTRDNYTEPKQNTLKDDKYIVYLFYAPWCGACKRFKPVWEQVRRRRREGLMREIDCDANPEMAQKYAIRHFPTIRVYDDSGKLIKEYDGDRDEESFEKFVVQYE